MPLTHSELKDFLEAKYRQYNNADFIPPDPISIPHLFTKKEDIEIAGFLTAVISWGQRPVILRNAKQLLEMMEMAPFDFIQNFSEDDLQPFRKFKHRTFNGVDCIFFLQSLQNIYTNHGGLESIFQEKTIVSGLIDLKRVFFEPDHKIRTEKHLPDITKNASAKRMNMFLRWMVRKDNSGIDFGLWNIPESQLFCPLDLHSGNVARKLGLLNRKANDWKAVLELTENLRRFDPDDPVKYDFALFGLGVYEGF